MRIVGDTIIFKSTTENYFKEFNGFKPNTIREIIYPSEFKQFVDFIKKLSPDSKIRIHETKNGEETGMSFERYITDITPFERYYIISWKHEEEKWKSHVTIVNTTSWIRTMSSPTTFVLKALSYQR